MNKPSSVFGIGLASALLLTMLVACISASATATLQLTPTPSATLLTPTPTLVSIDGLNIEGVVIKMRNDGFCLGDCPRYTLAIYGNGTVEYGGIDNVAVQGRRTAEISQERVRQLVEAFHEIDFFSFKDVY